MTVFDNVITRLRNTILGLGGDEPLMAAAVSAAALVIAADEEIAEEEIEAALSDLMTEPTLHANYRPSALAQELRLAIERSCTLAGRGDNLAMVSAIAHRTVEDRSNVLLVAIDVAMAHQGVGDAEDRMLCELASRLAVDKATLMTTAETQRLVTGAGLDLGGKT